MVNVYLYTYKCYCWSLSEFILPNKISSTKNEGIIVLQVRLVHSFIFFFLQKTRFTIIITCVLNQTEVYLTQDIDISEYWHKFKQLYVSLKSGIARRTTWILCLSIFQNKNKLSLGIRYRVSPNMKPSQISSDNFKFLSVIQTIWTYSRLSLFQNELLDWQKRQRV